MSHAEMREVFLGEPGHTFPRPSTSALASSAKRSEPVAEQGATEALQLGLVVWNGMVIQPAVANPPQPSPRFPQRSVLPLPELVADGL